MASLSSPTTAWTLLLIAGVLEIVWSTSMKASAGFSHALYTGVTLVAAWLSFWLRVPISTLTYPRRPSRSAIVWWVVCRVMSSPRRTISSFVWMRSALRSQMLQPVISSLW